MSRVLEAIKAVVPDRDRTYFFSPTSGDTELDLRDAIQKTSIVVDLAGGVNGTIILPNVSEAVGVPYSILLRNANSKSVTIKTYGAEDWSDITLNADDESVELVSNGIKYVDREGNYS